MEYIWNKIIQYLINCYEINNKLYCQYISYDFNIFIYIVLFIYLTILFFLNGCTKLKQIKAKI